MTRHVLLVGAMGVTIVYHGPHRLAQSCDFGQSQVAVQSWEAGHWFSVGIDVPTGSNGNQAEGSPVASTPQSGQSTDNESSAGAD
jgi:hypothetical protein